MVKHIDMRTHNLNLRLTDIVYDLTDESGDSLFALAGELESLLPPVHRKTVEQLMDGVTRWRAQSVHTAIKVATLMHGLDEPPEPVLRPITH